MYTMTNEQRTSTTYKTIGDIRFQFSITLLFCDKKFEKIE